MGTVLVKIQNKILLLLMKHESCSYNAHVHVVPLVHIGQMVAL